MKVLFVYPDIKKYGLYRGSFYSGIAYLSAALKTGLKCEVSLLHATKPLAKIHFAEKLKSIKPDMVAFSSTTNMFPYVRLWSKWVKESDKDITVLCGGTHCTILPEEVIDVPNIDVVCIGEGEESIVELCDELNRGLDITQVKGLYTKNNDKIYRNEMRPLIENLDTLPYPDRTIFDYPNLHTEREGCATVMVSRGCPFGCSYCCNTALRNIYKNPANYVRFRSVEKTISELKNILGTYPSITRFNFDDDILPLRKEWFNGFTHNYKKEIGVPYECNIHPSLITEETVKLLKSSGCDRIRIGVESGNEHVRKQVLARNISNRRISEAFNLCQQNGIKTFSFNMVGLPDEEAGSMLDTVKLNARIKSDRNQITIFYPYPGTRLYEICESQNLINHNREVGDYTEDTILNFSKIKRNRIIFIQRYFRVLVKCYQLIHKLPVHLLRLNEIILDKLIEARIMALFVFPFMNAAVDRTMKNKFLGTIVRKIYRRLLLSERKT